MTEYGPAASVKGSAKKPASGTGPRPAVPSCGEARPPFRACLPVSNNAPLPGGTDSAASVRAAGVSIADRGVCWRDPANYSYQRRPAIVERCRCGSALVTRLARAKVTLLQADSQT
ncbi:hypothetical protein MPRG_22540 [Mycobacterium paragordonae]|uniref:Uncharacterized protein n=1 Tax=Mycobacterium paragordonae TaxID=1389713 RepID=A0ABQ1C4U2_9MYCO|nr:hypothetical protein MPRG_22540 [Mycobacterium paragordonae]